jgi:hypothetical protein|tara:strand:+ start:31 stop:213 length:183 start_codon:yes stop_codon:yes gene_type:complete
MEIYQIPPKAIKVRQNPSEATNTEIRLCPSTAKDSKLEKLKTWNSKNPTPKKKSNSKNKN